MDTFDQSQMRGQKISSMISETDQQILDLLSNVDSAFLFGYKNKSPAVDRIVPTVDDVRRSRKQSNSRSVQIIGGHDSNVSPPAENAT